MSQAAQEHQDGEPTPRRRLAEAPLADDIAVYVAEHAAQAPPPSEGIRARLAGLLAR